MRFFHVFQLMICFILFQFCTLQLASAQNTPTLNIQGVLRNSNGTAVENGVYKIKFSLYTVETGGVAVWSETQDSLVVNGGVYSTALGKKTPMNAAFDQVYYLGVKVGSGQEMTPRALLSSAPYALSLIGQSNTFPSSGGIGAGTNTPAANYQLHAYNNNNAKILVEGGNIANIDLKKSNSDYFATMGLVDGGYFDINARGNTRFKWNGTTQIEIGSNLVSFTNIATNNLRVNRITEVGDFSQPSESGGWNFLVRGSSYLDGFVQVAGTGVRAWNPGPANYINENTSPFVQIFPGDRALGFCMSVGGWLRANQIFLSSDSRIKKNFSRSEGAADLDILRKLQVTNYQHIDTLEHGSRLKKGFVAQEVKKVMENAVTITSDFIPNIFTVTKNIKFASGKLTVTLDKNHGLEVGDVVKLYNEKEEKVKVLAVPSGSTFVVEWSTSAPKEEKIFVYGKAVRDFHSVEYDQIFTLNVSATQELARQVEQLKKENEALKSENGVLKAADEKFETRLRMLESKLNN